MLKIKSFGGQDVTHFVKYTLEKLISNKFATQISFTGKPFKKSSATPKLAFNKLKLFQLISREYKNKVI